MFYCKQLIYFVQFKNGSENTKSDLQGTSLTTTQTNWDSFLQPVLVCETAEPQTDAICFSRTVALVLLASLKKPSCDLLSMMVSRFLVLCDWVVDYAVRQFGDWNLGLRNIIMTDAFYNVYA